MHNIVNGFLAPTLHCTSALPFSSKWIELNAWIYPVDTIRFAFATLSVWSRLLHWTTFYATPSRSTPHRRRTEATAAEHKRTRNESELAERGCAKIRWVVVCVSANWVAPCATATSFDCDYHHLPMAFVSVRIGLIKFWLKRIFNLFCIGFPCDQSRWPS